MEPGDLLCVYSDGYSEAFDESDNEFGEERLEQTRARLVDRRSGMYNLGSVLYEILRTNVAGHFNERCITPLLHNHGNTSCFLGPLLSTSPLRLVYGWVKFPKLGTDCRLASVSVPTRLG